MTATPSGNLVCYIISLSPQAENPVKLQASLANQGILAQVFSAVDGRQKRPKLQGREVYNIDQALTRHGQELTNSEIGCYLSHYRVIQQAYEKGASFVCVLEDDVAIEANFGGVVNDLMAQDLELVRLMALKLRRRKVVKTLTDGTLLTRPERGVLGTQAYLFNRRGMKKFLDHAWNMYEQIDHVLDHFFLFDLAQYAVEPHIALELPSSSSVAKKPKASSRQPNLWQKIRHHPAKLGFSLRRHAYLRNNKTDFYPNELPTKRPGKSERLRGKGKAADVLKP